MKTNLRSGSFAAALFLVLTFSLTLLARPAAQSDGKQDGSTGIQHVLLISIDGMHALDFINCANGIKGANGGEPYCPNLTSLKPTGIDYLYASTSKPSDSFPGLTALVSGSSPRSAGAFYDVAYDRSLDPPTSQPAMAWPVALRALRTPSGTTTEFDEGIDKDKTQLNGGAPFGVDGGSSVDRSEETGARSGKGCAPVYPWNFVRTNTIFGVVHAAGGYTAWSTSIRLTLQ